MNHLKVCPSKVSLLSLPVRMNYTAGKVIYEFNG